MASSPIFTLLKLKQGLYKEAMMPPALIRALFGSPTNNSVSKAVSKGKIFFIYFKYFLCYFTVICTVKARVDTLY